MKCLGLFTVLLLAFVFSPADAAETEVIRLFDPNLNLPKEELLDLLKKANLEAYGFKNITETSIETDENGKQRLEKTIHYMVTDRCSRVMFWENVLEQRLGVADGKLRLKLGKTFVKQIQSRVGQRNTTDCEFGLEIHLNRCGQSPSRLAKRSASLPQLQEGPSGCCCCCCSCKVKYRQD